MDVEEFEGLTPDQAKERIADIMYKGDDPYFTRDHPGHKRAVERMTKLHQIAYGDEGEGGYDSLEQTLRDQGIETIEDLEALEDESLTKLEKEGLERADKAMQREFGAEYKEMSELAREGVDFAAGEIPELIEALEKVGPDGKCLGNDPQVARLFARIGKIVRKAKEGGAEE
jgi:hypothetical protein